MQSDTYDGVYRAQYSGVPVYEILVQGHPIMRRQSDSYMNATQILKVAGIDKGKRTKILEREILIGEHEKIQGGYGKYQGTWIPFDMGKELAERYNVHHLLQPLFDFQPPERETDIPKKDEIFKRANRQAAAAAAAAAAAVAAAAAAAAATASSQQHSPPPSPSTSSVAAASPHPAKRQKRSHEGERSALMALFLDDDSDTLPDLVDMDIDLVIDDQGHTAVHWAASLARIQTLQALLAHGADPARVNYAGETALMRSVMMNHCYDAACFPRLLATLRDTIHLTDYHRRNILHHTALSSALEEHHDAALYYMKHLLDTAAAAAMPITPTPSSSSQNSTATTTQSLHHQLQSLIDMQDTNGETCLNIATRLGMSEMADMLAAFSNADSRPEPPQPPSPSTQPPQPLPRIERTYAPSPRGREIISTVQKIVDALDEDYTTQLQERDEELQRTQSKLWAVTLQLNEARRKLEEHEKQHHDDGHDDMVGGHEGDNDDDDDDVIRSLEDSIHHNDGASSSARERWLEEQVKALQNQVDTQSKTHEQLTDQVESLRAQTTERELQCKRLIAACCNLPVERIDALLEPLLAAVESDPPDLEFAQVVNFMEKLRQNSNDNKPASSSSLT